MSTAPIFHIAFYRFVSLTELPLLASQIKALASALLGSVVLAPEGINGVLAGTAEALNAFEHELQQLPLFKDMSFKRSQCTTPPFGKLKVHLKKEIVAFGIDNVRPDELSVSPQEWRELIARDDVVVIDNRNSFEYRLGKFKGAIDPKVSHFKDFPAYVLANAPIWKQQGKQVAMYCTGGIRCEKSSAWMQSLGLKVSQLEGGVLNYFAHHPDAHKDFEGECFVFDNRIALDTKLCETKTTEAEVYDATADGAWRVARATRLASAVNDSDEGN